ncbi:mucin-5AC [Biomphalaria glabrata]
MAEEDDRGMALKVQVEELGPEVAELLESVNGAGVDREAVVVQIVQDVFVTEQSRSEPDPASSCAEASGETDYPSLDELPKDTTESARENNPAPTRYRPLVHKSQSLALKFAKMQLSKKVNSISARLAHADHPKRNPESKFCRPTIRSRRLPEPIPLPSKVSSTASSSADADKEQDPDATSKEEASAPTSKEEASAPTSREASAPTSKEEASATTSREASAHTSKEEASATTSKVEASAPTSKEEASAPTSKEEASAPISKEEAYAPTSKEEASAPTSREASAPTSKEEASAPTSKEEVSASRSKEEASTPTSKEEASAPTSKEEASAPTRKEEASSPTSKEAPAATSREHVSAPTSKEEASAITSKEAPAATSREHVSAPTSKEEASAITSKEAPAATSREHVSAPTSKEEASAITSKEAPAATSREHVSAPTSKEEASAITSKEAPAATSREHVSATTSKEEASAITSKEAPAATSREHVSAPTSTTTGNSNLDRIGNDSSGSTSRSPSASNRQRDLSPLKVPRTTHARPIGTERTACPLPFFPTLGVPETIPSQPTMTIDTSNVSATWPSVIPCQENVPVNPASVTSGPTHQASLSSSDNAVSRAVDHPDRQTIDSGQGYYKPPFYEITNATYSIPAVGSDQSHVTTNPTVVTSGPMHQASLILSDYAVPRALDHPDRQSNESGQDYYVTPFYDNKDSTQSLAAVDSDQRHVTINPTFVTSGLRQQELLSSSDNSDPRVQVHPDGQSGQAGYLPSFYDNRDHSTPVVSSDPIENIPRNTSLVIYEPRQAQAEANPNWQSGNTQEYIPVSPYHSGYTTTMPTVGTGQYAPTNNIQHVSHAWSANASGQIVMVPTGSSSVISDPSNAPTSFSSAPPVQRQVTANTSAETPHEVYPMMSSLTSSSSSEQSQASMASVSGADSTPTLRWNRMSLDFESRITRIRGPFPHYPYETLPEIIQRINSRGLDASSEEIAELQTATFIDDEMFKSMLSGNPAAIGYYQRSYQAMETPTSGIFDYPDRPPLRFCNNEAVIDISKAEMQDSLCCCASTSNSKMSIKNLQTFTKCLKIKYDKNYHENFIKAELFFYLDDNEQYKLLIKELKQKCQTGRERILKQLIRITRFTINLTFKIEVQGKNGTGRCIYSRKDDKLKFYTAWHVLKNKSEASLAQVFFDYNAESSTGTKTYKVETLIMSDIKKDQSQINIILPTEVEEKLKDDFIQLEKARKYVKRFWQCSQRAFCIIVSHPHGFSKHVTIGKHIFNETFTNYIENGLTLTGINEKEGPIAYTTPSCAGSSGGPLIYLNSLKEFLHKGYYSEGFNTSTWSLKI